MSKKCPLSVHDVHVWLEKVAFLDALINSKIAERDQVMTMATKITPALTGMPHQDGVSDKVGNAAQRLADMAVELNNLIDEYIDQKRAVVAVLEKLPPRLYMAMHKRYVLYETWEDIAEEMHISTVTLWRWHLKSLEILQSVMECNVKPEYNSIIE